jgi:hypothetical protein
MLALGEQDQRLIEEKIKSVLSLKPINTTLSKNRHKKN